MTTTAFNNTLSNYSQFNTLSSYVTTSSLNNTLTNYLTTASASTNYQPKITNSTNLICSSYSTALTQLADTAVPNGACGTLALISDVTNKYRTTLLTYTDGSTYFDNYQNGGSYYFRRFVGTY